MNKTLLASFALGLLVASSSAAPDGGSFAVLVDGTGNYSRAVGSPSRLAQQFFDQGLRLMYGYQIPEATASHLQALKHDPDNPMIHCALALTLGPNPNSRYGRMRDDPKGNARKAIERAVELIDSANPRDQSLIKAVRIRFDVDTYPNLQERDAAYLAALKELFALYPDDPDIGTLYADSYMVTKPWRYWTIEGEPRLGTMEAARALESVMANRPDHPGANHLYIHLMEAGPEPERALSAADRLEGLMPIGGHIVHMPSHVYVRTGQYEKAIATNERSLAADKNFLERWGNRPFPKIGTYYLSATNHGRHAVDFIRYAASVQGNYQRALSAARQERGTQSEAAIKHGKGQRSIVTPWMMHKMFGRWAALESEQRSHEGLPYVDGFWNYVQGSADIARGDLESAKLRLTDLRKLIDDPVAKKTYSRFNRVSTILRIAELGLEGELKQAAGDLPGAIEAFDQAVYLEDRLSYIEPPDWAQPMRHYLGAALLDAGRSEEAEQIYRRDLDWNRENGWSLFGLWQSLEAQGRFEEAARVRKEFNTAWQNADVTLSASRFY